MSEPDVLIIGGGPAASAAALRARQLGLSVTLICRQEKPFAAAESIHPGLQTLLSGLGVTDFPQSYATGIYRGIYGNGGYQPLDPGGSDSWQGHHIDKGKFNAALRAAAEKAGCHVIGATVYSLLNKNGRISGAATKDKIYHAGYLIDCSGRRQLAGRFLKLRKKYYSPPLTAWSGRSLGIGKTTSTSFFAEHDHWNWLAAEQNGVCSWTRLAGTGWPDFSPPPVLSGYKTEGPPAVWNVRWRIFRPLVAQGLLLCGDAAGIIDPAASQGILTALISGIAAANCVGEIFSQPASENLLLTRYDQWFLAGYENRAAQLRSLYQQLMPEWYEHHWVAKPTVT